MKANHLTDQQLVARAKKHCAARAKLLADLLVDLIDIEERRIHVRAACSSMQEYCRRHLSMSPSEAWRRATAARLIRRVPVLLDYVRRGEVDLSTLLLLRHFIDEENADELIRATRLKSKRQIERILESREPREKRSKRGNGAKTASALLERLEAISEELHLLEAAISNETRILIERARHLLNDTMPNAALADLIHRAFADLVAALEARRAELRAKRPAQQSPPGKNGRVSQAMEYIVFVRDGFQCTFTNADGVRCRATRYLEVDHIVPHAKGGSDELHNLRCVCHAHNQHLAELAFGKAFIQSRILKRQSRSATRLRWGRPLT